LNTGDIELFIVKFALDLTILFVYTNKQFSDLSH